MKALSLLEFLVKSGAERCIEEMRDHMRTIRSLQEYNFYEGNVDKGGGVREKAGQLISLLGSNESIREEREKARRLRDKFVGISNNGYGGAGRGDSFSGGSGGAGHSGGATGRGSRDSHSSESYSGGSSGSGGRYNSRYGNESFDRQPSDTGSGYGNGGIDSYANGGISSSKKSTARYGGGSYDTENKSRYSDEVTDPLDHRNSPGRNGLNRAYDDSYASHSSDIGDDMSNKKSSSKMKITIKDSKSRATPAESQSHTEVDLFADPTSASISTSAQVQAPLFDAFAGMRLLLSIFLV